MSASRNLQKASEELLPTHIKASIELLCQNTR